MGITRIVVGQRVDPIKRQRAKELRRQMTTEEGILWQDLRGNKLRGLHFRRQQVIEGFIVDFYCHTAGLVIEVDGDIHQDQADYDVERDRVLSALGLRVLRFSNEDIEQNLPAVLDQIADCAKGQT